MKEIISKKIELPNEQEFAELAIISDVHYGNKTCAKEFFEFVMDWAYKNPHVYVITNGDLLECSIRDSVGLYDQNVEIDDQIDYILDKFSPLAEENRLIGMLRGNHERRVSKLTNMDLTKRMANDLGVPYGYRGMFFEIRTKTESQRKHQRYTMYGTHGSSGAWTTGGKINACMRLLQAVEAELYFMGHVHELLHITIPRKRVDRGSVQEIPTHFVLTGSYLEYWESYAQEKGYPPTALGSPKIKLHTKTHRMSVSA